MASTPPCAPCAPCALPAPKYKRQSIPDQRATVASTLSTACTGVDCVAANGQPILPVQTHLQRITSLDASTFFLPLAQTSAADSSFSSTFTCPINQTVYVFDLDNTLKYASLMEMEPASSNSTSNPSNNNNTSMVPARKIRGGTDTVTLLRQLKQDGALLLVATARSPSLLKHQTVKMVLQSLNLYEFFQDPLIPVQKLLVDAQTFAFVGDGILVCDYYKPHSVHAYLALLSNTACADDGAEERAERGRWQRLVFVDDFVVNVCSFTDYFASFTSPFHRQLHVMPAGTKSKLTNTTHDCVHNRNTSKNSTTTHENEQAQVQQWPASLQRVEGYWWDPLPLIQQGFITESKTENSYEEEYTAYRQLFQQ